MIALRYHRGSTLPDGELVTNVDMTIFDKTEVAVRQDDPAGAVLFTLTSLAFKVTPTATSVICAWLPVDLGALVPGQYGVEVRGYLGVEYRSWTGYLIVE